MAPAWAAQAIFLAGLLENFDRWGLGMALEYLGEKAAEDASIARLLQSDPRLRQVRSCLFIIAHMPAAPAFVLSLIA